MHVITFKQTFKIPFLRRKFQFAIHNPNTINYFPSFLCFFLSSFSLPLSLKPSPITLFSRLDTRQHHSHFISQITFLCYSLITSIGFKYQNRSLSSQSPPDRFEEWKPNIPSKHSLLSPPSSPACNQRNQIPDFAFEIKRWRGKAIEMGNLEFVEWQTCAN